MYYKTQSSSKARLKKDTIGDEGLTKLYEAHSYMGIEQFREYCIQLVQSGGGNQPMKDAIIADIENALNKDRMLTKTNNFIFAGQGYGV